MANCFSWTSLRNNCLRFSFSRAGLRSTTSNLGEGTIMHCWVPKKSKPGKPNLLLLHGLGANAMWQWNDYLSPLVSKFNVFVPDLVFFGGSCTTRPERTECFQAQCVMTLMEANGVKKMDVVGMSYGGFVAYSLASQFRERVGKLVLCGAGVSIEENDIEEGLFSLKSVDEAVSILLPQTPDKVRDLMRLTFHKAPRSMPSCFLQDFIDVMCRDYHRERVELIHALINDRQLSNLPKITQSPLIIWGEHDRLFPMELANRLTRHLNGNAQLVILKDAGHAFSVEKSKEMSKILNSFLMDPVAPNRHGNRRNAWKAD